MLTLTKIRSRRFTQFKGLRFTSTQHPPAFVYFAKYWQYWITLLTLAGQDVWKLLTDCVKQGYNALLLIFLGGGIRTTWLSFLPIFDFGNGHRQPCICQGANVLCHPVYDWISFSLLLDTPLQWKLHNNCPSWHDEALRFNYPFTLIEHVTCRSGFLTLSSEPKFTIFH